MTNANTAHGLPHHFFIRCQLAHTTLLLPFRLYSSSFHSNKTYSHSQAQLNSLSHMETRVGFKTFKYKNWLNISICTTNTNTLNLVLCKCWINCLVWFCLIIIYCFSHTFFYSNWNLLGKTNLKKQNNPSEQHQQPLYSVQTVCVLFV